VAIDHPVLHLLGVRKGHVPLDPRSLVLEGELSLEERRGSVAGEPVGESGEGIEVVVVVL
jgi:hypothetical protein